MATPLDWNFVDDYRLPRRLADTTLQLRSAQRRRLETCSVAAGQTCQPETEVDCRPTPTRDR